jgi:peroxiredoxin Q/BCP
VSDRTKTLRERQAAPDFTLPATDGREVRLQDYRGEYLLLLFYPLAWTPV